MPSPGKDPGAYSIMVYGVHPYQLMNFSTLNETLLIHHALDRTKDDATRLFLLSGYLDTMRLTLFRQTMFAEFELLNHQSVDRGEPLAEGIIGTQAVASGSAQKGCDAYLKLLSSG